MVGNFVLQSQLTEPAMCKIQMHFFAQPALGPNAEAVAYDQHANHEFWINRGASGVAVERGKMLP